MKRLVALLCAALFFIFPMTALASGASVPTRVPDIGEAVTTYTKDAAAVRYGGMPLS